MEKRNKDLRSVGRMQYKNSYTNCRLDAFFLCPKREGHMSGSTPSRSSSRTSLSHRLKSMLFSEVPRESAICEFDCPRNQCTHGEWATCQRRIQLEALCHPKQADGAPCASCPNPSIQIAYSKYSVNPWLRVVTRLSLFGCDEPSSTEPRWIVATTG